MTLFLPVTTGTEITREFGTTTNTRSGWFHDGINFASNPSEPIRASGVGQVIRTIQNHPILGNTVIVRHFYDNVCTLYSNLDNIRVGRGQTVNPATTIASPSNSLHFEVIDRNVANAIALSRDPELGIPIGTGFARMNPRMWFEHYRDEEFSTHVNDPLSRGLIEGDNRDNWIFSNQNGNFLNGLRGDDVYVENSLFTQNLINDDDRTGELLIDFVSLYGQAKPKTDSAGNVFYGSWSCDQGHDLYQYGSDLNIKKSTSIKSDAVGGEITIQNYPFNTFFAPYNLDLIDPQYMEDIVVNYDMQSGNQFTNSSLSKSIVHASRNSPSTLLISENAHSTTVLMGFNGPYSKIDLGVPFSEVKVYQSDSGLYSIDDFLNGKFVADDDHLISSKKASDVKTSQDSKRNLATGIRNEQNFCVLILPNNQTVMLVGVKAQTLFDNPDLYIESQLVVTQNPSATPSQQPIPDPSSQPSQQPIPNPSGQPSQQPIPNPSGQPSQQPIPNPSGQPSQQPIPNPSGQPSQQPIPNPSGQPSQQPIPNPSGQPSQQPIPNPSGQPSQRPIPNPSGLPSQSPESSWPSLFPTQQSIEPSAYPSEFPTIKDFSNSTSSTRNSNDIPATIIAPVALLFVGALAYVAKKFIRKSAPVAVTETDNLELDHVEFGLLDGENAEIEASIKQKPNDTQKPNNAFTLRGNSRKKVIPISNPKDEGSITR